MTIRSWLSVLLLTVSATVIGVGCGEEKEEERVEEEGIEEGRVLFSYDAEDKKQTLYLASQGSSCIYWQEYGHQSDNCFRIASRETQRDGVVLDLVEQDVIGKWLHVSYWVYHQSEEERSIGCSLQILRPDRVTVEWPESVWTGPIPSETWVHVEGKIPVYADALDPKLIFEADGTDDFLLDDIYITVDDQSVTKANYLTVDEDIEPFTGVSLDFEDGEIFFANRGDGVTSVTDDAYQGEGALLVSGRTEVWHGVEKDFFGAQTEGKTLAVQAWIKNNEERPVVFAITLSEEKVSKSVEYRAVAQTEEVPAGEWILMQGTVDVELDTVRPILYFEARDMTASFTLDDVRIDLLE